MLLLMYERQHCGALLELPTGCAFWNDKRMLDLMSGTDCRHFHVHGWLYGVVEQDGGAGRSKNLVVSLVKPWQTKRLRAQM